MPSDYIEVMRAMDEAMNKNDTDGFFAQFTDDIKVHVRGNNKLAGDHEGKQKFQELFGQFMEAAGDYTFEVHDYLAGDDHGVTLQNSRFQRGGKTLELQEAFIMHFREGKVSEMWYLPMDAAAFDAWIGR